MGIQYSVCCVCMCLCTAFSPNGMQYAVAITLYFPLPICFIRQCADLRVLHTKLEEQEKETVSSANITNVSILFDFF